MVRRTEGACRVQSWKSKLKTGKSKPKNGRAGASDYAMMNAASGGFEKQEAKFLRRKLRSMKSIDEIGSSVEVEGGVESARSEEIVQNGMRKWGSLQLVVYPSRETAS